VSSHSETLAGNGLPIANALHQAIANDGVLMLTYTDAQEFTVNPNVSNQSNQKLHITVVNQQ